MDTQANKPDPELTHAQSAEGSEERWYRRNRRIATSGRGSAGSTTRRITHTRTERRRKWTCMKHSYTMWQQRRCRKNPCR